MQPFDQGAIARPAAPPRTPSRRLAACAVGAALTGLFLALPPGVAQAADAAAISTDKVLRVADQGDALSMDPHSLNESLQLSVLGNIYEAMVAHGKDLKLIPALATEWKQTSPTTWVFTLRKGVTFHDGSPFTADDVVFSVERSREAGSDMRVYTSMVQSVTAKDAHTVEFVTATPFPILPDNLAMIYIMSRKWAVANQAEKPVDKRKGQENAASIRANGTGPFRLRAREPGIRTTMARFAGHWEKPEGNVGEVIYTPIGNDATRVAALLSGQVDMIAPVPIQDIARLEKMPNLTVMTGPELRTIFLGLDQKRDELLFSNIKGKNPFKDVRVRQAMYQAIDIVAIQKRIMRGASTPSALMVAPGIRGFAEDLNTRTPFDPDAAKKLMQEAGYADGFEVKLNCPNDRYNNDSEICQAVTGMLARINVKVKLEAETKATYFPKILSRNTSFYMLGWTPSNYDAHNPLNSLMATPGANGQGQFNLGSYSNARIDEITQAVAAEVDPAKRNALIHEAFSIHKKEFGHIPLHQQRLAWGMKKGVHAVQLPDNFNYYRWIKVD